MVAWPDQYDMQHMSPMEIQVQVCMKWPRWHGGHIGFQQYRYAHVYHMPHTHARAWHLLQPSPAASLSQHRCMHYCTYIPTLHAPKQDLLNIRTFGSLPAASIARLLLVPDSMYASQPQPQVRRSKHNPCIRFINCMKLCHVTLYIRPRTSMSSQVLPQQVHIPTPVGPQAWSLCRLGIPTIQMHA